MEEKSYQVVYVDKFYDARESATVSQNLRDLFGLNEKVIRRLASGEPVVVKKWVSYSIAEPIHVAICEAGGTAWIEEMEEGRGLGYRDRRMQQRRQLSDRRQHYRGSSILPDRRNKCGRRSSDGFQRH